jgi:hypothetical protein
MNKAQQKHLILLAVVGIVIWKRDEIKNLFSAKEAYGCKACGV